MVTSQVEKVKEEKAPTSRQTEAALTAGREHDRMLLAKAGA